MTNDALACTRMLQYRPPRIAFALLAGAGTIHILMPAAVPAVNALPIAGALLGITGFLVMLRAWWLFRQCGTAICPTSKTTALITHDIFRLTRNPMYLGIVLMLLGIAIATGGILFYLAALAYFLIIDKVFCPYEEQKLARDFGASFASYCRQTRRWL